MSSTVQSFSDMAPSPRAVIDLDPADLDPGTEYVTVHQLSKWGRQEVRGTTRQRLLGGLIATDYEIPLAVPVTYRVEQFDADLEPLGFVLSLGARVDLPDTGRQAFGKVVVQDPIAPASAIMLDARPGSFAQLQKQFDLVVYNAGTSTVGLGGLRSLLRDVPFIFITDTVEQREKLDAILAANPILIRADPRTRLPGCFYAAAASITQAPHDPNLWSDTDDWSLTASEVTRPALAVVVALLNYELFQEYVQATTAGTYDDAKAIWLTYLDALRTPPEVS